MSDAAGTPNWRQRGGVEGLSYAAAVFWFATLGVMAFVGAIFLVPLMCWGDPPPGSDGPCPSGLPPYIENGSLAVYAAISVGVIIIAVVAWPATAGRPNGRAVAMLIPGAIAALCVVLSFVAAWGLGLVATLWLGIPAVLLVSAGVGRVRRNLRSPVDTLGRDHDLRRLPRR